jgi:hypothetical protein
MSDIRKMSSVAVAMQSALAAAKTITAITEAAPGVVSSTSHGYSNGDYVLLEVQGMWQVNDRIFRVADVSADAFKLEDVSGGGGIDTTDYDTFSSGTAKKITFGTSITTMSSAQMSGGEFDKLDTSVIHAATKTSIPGTANAFEMEFEHNWDVTDAGQAALKVASDAQAKRAFKFTFGVGGRIVLFYGYVGHSALPNAAGFGAVIKTKTTITAEGAPTYYSA